MLVQSPLETGSSDLHNDTLVSVHASSYAKGMSREDRCGIHIPGKWQVCVCEQQNIPREVTPQGFLSKWNK